MTVLWYGTDLIASHFTALQLWADGEGRTAWTFATDQGERAPAGGTAKALPALQCCSRLQNAAGTGKCADHENLERSF